MTSALGAGAALRPPYLRPDVSGLFATLRLAGAVGCVAVVSHAEGSTYSKPGALMLFAADGRQAGLLSGGCLEGDLADRAARVMHSGLPEVVHYDARDVEQDVLFGLAFGCEGLLRIHLLPLGPQQGYEPLATLAAATAAGQGVVWGLFTAGPRDGQVLVAPTALQAHTPVQGWTLPGGHAALAGGMAGGMPGGMAADEELLLLRLAPVPRLLLLGAGAEAPALAAGALALGWQVTVLDHRSSWASPARFAAGVEVRTVDPREPIAAVEPSASGVPALPAADAAVVMAHHLEVDAAWLACLAETHTPWIGLLGPAARRGRLLARIGLQSPAFAGRVQGPVGLPVGARTPEEIALSILAAAQQAVAAQGNG
jgi:xanthine dehydrogenase accessory factor